jgi:hypothetical protein
MDRRGHAPVPAALRQAAAVGWRVLVLLVLSWLVVRPLVRLRLVVVPVIVALFLTSVLLPPVNWLRARGWPSAAATAAVLLVAVLGLAGAGWLLAVRVVPQLGELSARSAARSTGSSTGSSRAPSASPRPSFSTCWNGPSRSCATAATCWSSAPWAGRRRCWSWSPVPCSRPC